MTTIAARADGTIHLDSRGRRSHDEALAIGLVVAIGRLASVIRAPETLNFYLATRFGRLLRRPRLFTSLIFIAGSSLAPAPPADAACRYVSRPAERPAGDRQHERLTRARRRRRFP